MSNVEAAIGELEHVKGQFLRALENTPDERLNWSPSPTSRTPLQLMAHSAYSLGFIRTMFTGTPYPTPTMAEADAEFMEMDGKIGSREEAVNLFEEKCDDMVTYLRGLAADEMDRMIDMPFKLGQAPLGAVLGVGALHTRHHLAQLEYLQTIYGDRVW
jgi:hypothetical protein